MNTATVCRLLPACVLPWLLLGCGPESFDANSQGVIAFADGNELCTVRSDGTERKELLRLGAGTKSINWLRWSPDGKRLAYVASSDKEGRLYVVDADGRNNQVVVGHLRDDDITMPFWSPDSSRLGVPIYPEDADEKPYDICIVDLKTGAKTNLAGFVGPSAQFSPDGRKLLFCKSAIPWGKAATLGEVVVYDFDKKEESSLAAIVIGLNVVGWLDRENALFSCRRLELPAIHVGSSSLDDSEKQSRIFRVSVGKREIVPVTRRDGAFYFALSPDRKKILYVERGPEDDKEKVIVADADGGHPKEIWDKNSGLPFWVGDDSVAVYNEDQEYVPTGPNSIQIATKGRAIVVIAVATGKKTVIPLSK